MSRRRKVKGRHVHGVLLLDKPAGMTSNETLQKVKKLFNAAKAGHTGSLDKAATGLLPLCFGEATKFSNYLLDANKRYVACCQLGSETTTGDAEGEVCSQKPVPDFSRAELEKTLAKFRGDIEQVPPMYSALKHKGQRLYKLAHQGIEVERPPRPVSIYRLELLKYEQQQLTIDVSCSKGTYIRTLAEDIGRELGCGAHVHSLRRTASGPFTEEQMISLAELQELAAQGMAQLDEQLLGIDAILPDMPAIYLKESVAYYLCQGQAVIVPRAPTEGMLRVYNEDEHFLGLAEVLDDGRIGPRRLISH